MLIAMNTDSLAHWLVVSAIAGFLLGALGFFLVAYGYKKRRVGLSFLGICALLTGGGLFVLGAYGGQNVWAPRQDALDILHRVRVAGDLSRCYPSATITPDVISLEDHTARVVYPKTMINPNGATFTINYEDVAGQAVTSDCPAN